MRRRHRRIDLVEDDGLVRLGGELVSAAQAEWNARYHMAGFDELPRSWRDRFNYAPTPEEGARPTRDLVAEAKAAARAKLLRR